MKRILITGFEPFDKETVNPSWEAVSRLPDKIGGYMLTRLCLPVVFCKAAEIVIGVADDICPDIILCIGQAGGRSKITPELVAINLRHATIPDNEGNQPNDMQIIKGGDVAYFSALPVRKMEKAINECGVPAAVSYSAGTYVCNDLLYTLLARFQNTETKVGFIHIPYIEEQNKQPSMKLDDIIKGLIGAIECLDFYEIQ